MFCSCGSPGRKTRGKIGVSDAEADLDDHNTCEGDTDEDDTSETIDNEDDTSEAIDDEDEAKNLEKLKARLQPKTPHFFSYNGDRLHVRHWLPASTATCKGTVFYIHGLNGHLNGLASIQKAIAQAGFAVLGLDIVGHGYSEGLRSYVEDFEDVFDSVLHFVGLVMGSLADDDESDLGLSDSILKLMRSKPYFFLGESMGGMLAMYVSIRLHQDSGVCTERHEGTILIAPSLAVSIPSPPVVALLQTVVVPLAREQLMPESVSKASRPQPELQWRDPEEAHLRELDDWNRFPGVGLSWKERMRWATASAFASIYQGIDDEMKAVDFPFLVLHDPDDGICAYSGSEKLVELSPSQDKKLVEAKGALHDVSTNELPWVLDQILPWLDCHL